jgi:CheY-like chemotaxis protein
MRSLMSRMLQRAGFEVVAAANGLRKPVRSTELVQALRECLE